MRPLPGGDAPPPAKPRSRKSSVADGAVMSNGPSSHVPTTFFMRTEEDMEQSMQASRSADSVRRQRESTFGVQSLADTLDAAFGTEKLPGDNKGDSGPAHAPQIRRSVRRASYGSSRSVKKDSDSSKSSPRACHRNVSSNSFSNLFTPQSAESRSPIPPSAMPSSPTSTSLQSLKLSDEETGPDEVASQALASSGEEEEDTRLDDESSSFPQLVMPSIQMPARRPFTTKGKAMGKLKVLVAGQAGLGKTSLIRSIVQLCDDIVHVDPLSPSSSISHSSPHKVRSRKRTATSTPHITETHASTKPYPPWWTDVEESRVLRKGKSSTDTVLERNLCFVDTPGYSADSSKAEDIGRVVDYVESLFYQTTSVISMDENDLVGVISGSGGIAVDVVFYLLPPSHDISHDVEFMQRLSALTNVIPIIAKVDTLSATELVAVKTSILARLQTTSIKPFFFGNAIDDALFAVQELSLEQSLSLSASSDDKTALEPKQYPFHNPTLPYAVSSIQGPDAHTMDASLLMSPDYVQPLLPSELAALVDRVFDPESIAWLRHSAAKKFIGWRRRTKLPGDSFILQSLQQQTLRRGSVSTSASVGLNGAPLNTSAASSIFTAASPSGVLVPHAGSPYYTSNLQSPFLTSSPSLAHTQPENLEHPTDFSLTRYNNTLQGEQRLAEVRLAKWATDLQRSLRNEKDRFEELQRNERAKWLLERVGEEVASGNIVASPGGSPRADWAVIRHGNGKEAINMNVGQRYGKASSLDARDPLGLCDFSDEVRRRGFVLVRVLGGMSVLGAVMVTVVRVCGWEMGLPEGGLWKWVTGQTEQ
ncbi:hypothetical protein BU23DRAFT_579115 [Bimuria novae-zelandiae CBS 107.79]|uniref:Septin-type G domain-containing protein n=1 Tax=Bimuria novae-zelandiae CBS 107.79 TaxID=1447943 RepID=A0A6A5VD98_9PLEO|nr:hypothetical protein BU23DRAFT_579115 [Bimuria novae-zelandiae CBS 107.79]